MKIESRLDISSTDFGRNSEAMRGLVTELRYKLNQVSGGGGKASRARHTSRGRMLARQRVDLLIDPGTAFPELSPLAADGLYGGDVHSASIVTGVGRISGRECVAVANDAIIKGGTYYPMTVKKHLRAQDIARQNNLPCVYMVDSGGAFLPMQDEIFSGRASLRPHLLQPGADVRGRNPADRDRDGLLHGRRRLCACDVGREHHRAESRHDLSRRPAAGEGGDRRGGDRRRAGRRRRAFAPVRRHRSLCAE
jgi:Carboxyl transferase domain